MIRFYSGPYRCLTVFAEMEPDEVAEITIESAQGIVRKKAERYRKVLFSLTEHMEYTVQTTVGKIRYAYLCGTSKQESRGISFLTGKRDESLLHFMPHGSRMEALGGFIFYKDYYHIFYAFNPFAQNADLLYWGHAVSRDMLSWKEMPLLLEPAVALTKVRHRTGGAAGGSVEVMEDRIRLYITRSIGDRKTGAVLNEYLTWTQSRDAVHISQEKPMHLTMPNRKNKIFRDPKVTETDGVRYMVVGSAAPGRAAVLLYRENGEDWEYREPLFRIGNGEVQAIGTPDFFTLGRTKVALGTLLGFTEAGRENPVCWYTGSFQNDKMRIRQRGWLDFGGDFHAPQTMEKDGRRLMVGCLGNGSLSVPRELFIRKGRLCQKPAREVYAWKETPYYEGKGENISISLENTAYMGEVLFSAKTDFKLQIGKGLSLCFADDAFFIETSEGRFYAEATDVYKVEFFVENGTLEVFLNDEEAGTKQFTGIVDTFTATFSSVENVERLTFFTKKH